MRRKGVQVIAKKSEAKQMEAQALKQEVIAYSLNTTLTLILAASSLTLTLTLFEGAPHRGVKKGHPHQKVKRGDQ